MNEHEHGKDHEVQSGQRFWQTFIVSRQSAEAIGPAETAFHHPPSGQQDEAFLGFGQLDDLQRHAFVACGLGRLRSGIALVGIRHLHRLAACLLHLLRQFLYLGALLFVGRRDMHGKQIPQRIDSHMDFASPLALVPIVPRPRPAFTGRLQRASIKNDGAGVF